MKHSDIKSSNIRSIAYDEKSKSLEIIFKNGGHYSYEGVPLETHKALVGADSPGNYFFQRVKTKYKFRKVTKDGHASK